MKAIIFLISLTVTLIWIPLVKKMLLVSNITKKNYKGDIIPVGIGVVIIPVTIINNIFINIFNRDNIETQQFMLFFLVGIMTMASVGLIDDLIGNRHQVGFKGHIISLFKGKLTTGGLKAIIGGLIGLFLGGLIGSSILEVIVNASILALFTNFINLLDLRPGRALKGFLFICILFIINNIYSEIKVILFSIIGYAVGCLPQDIKEKAMMGDVGSNTLGIILGIVTIISYTLIVKYIILALLITIHIITEKYSLTSIIKNNSILNFVDELGRS